MKTWIGCLLGAMALLLFSCQSEKKTEEVAVDLPQILEKKELVVLTVNSSVSYFNYRGEPMGFQYELAQQFAKSLGLTLKVKVVKDEEGLVDSLLSGAGDLVAYNLIMTNALKDSLIYCGEEDITRQVIVQRRGKEALKDVTELVGKKVYVNSGKYRTRLENLNRELGGGIDICEVSSDSVSSEDLITWVAEGRIDYTVATDEIAKINRTYYPVLDIKLAISFDQRSSWAVRKTSVLLAEAADKWHRENINSSEFRASARRYFELNKRTTHGSILSLKDGKISHYDDLFRKYAKEIGWDWRMLASLVYTESNFDPNVISWAGARGLMQITEVTFDWIKTKIAPTEDLTFDDLYDPETNIRFGSYFVSYCLLRYDDHLATAAAAYHNGVGAVDALLKETQYSSDGITLDHYPYPQMRQYVKKITESYQRYSEIYN